MNAAFPTFSTPTSKKIRRKSRFHSLQMRSSFFRRNQQIILLTSAIAAWSLSLLWLIRRWIYGEHTIVTNVQFSPQSDEIYNNEDLKNQVTTELLWKSSLICRFRCADNVLDTVHTTYPFIEDIRIRRPDSKTLSVAFTFASPRVVFQLNDSKRATYDEHYYKLSPFFTRGQDKTPIYLPQYLGALSGLDGIFFKTPEATFITTLETIYATLRSWSIQAITYLPGWEKLLIEYNQKSVYLDLTKNIDLQLTKLIDLELYYADFPKIEKIDLGSSEYAIIK